MGSLSSKKKSLNSTKLKAPKRKRKNYPSEDSLADEDVNIVTVPLDSTATDHRISKAKELIASGKPISITLEAEKEQPGEKNKETVWQDEAARDRWKGQLELMRHFYDWEEIPLDFFVDSYVGISGEALRKRRLSLNIVTEPEATPDPMPMKAIQPVIPHNRSLAADIKPRPFSFATQPIPVQVARQVTEAPRTRAASVAVTDHQYLPVTLAESIPAGDTKKGAESAKLPMLPIVAAALTMEGVPGMPASKGVPSQQTEKRFAPSLPHRPPRHEVPAVSELQGTTRARAASVAIGEAFPIPEAVLHKQNVTRTRSPSVVKPMDENTPAPEFGAAAVSAVAERRAQSNQSEGRARGASVTNIDQVYGRLAKPTGAYDRFEMENPAFNSGNVVSSPRRSTVSDKRPDQFKNLAPIIDPTQFANERRSTRHSITQRNSHVEKAIFNDGRVSSSSTQLESKLSATIPEDIDRSRSLSDWL